MSSASSKQKKSHGKRKPAGKERSKQRPKKLGPPFSLYNDPEDPSFDEGFESIIRLLKGKKNIAVLLGAGISVSCGIPDFRTKGSGIYSTLDAEELGLTCPEELFDINFFREDPAPFYKFAQHLYFPLGKNERVRPSDSHKLLALLEKKKMLLRCYSQNIDGLEEVAGVSSKKIVYAHGSLQWATCCKCKRKVSSEELEPDILKGTVPYCQAPVVRNTSRTSANNNKNKNTTNVCNTSKTRASSVSPRTSSRKRPRSASSSPTNESSPRSTIASDGTRVCGGVMKPAITFFGEALGNNVRRCLEADRNKVDALIVIGTSLSVAPISKVIGYLPPKIPRILINRTVVHPKHSYDEEGSDDEEEQDFREDYVFDAYMLGFCDDVTRALGKHLFSSSPADDNSVSSTGSPVNGAAEGQLLATLDDNDDEFSAKAWKSATKVPWERVFLFPGAQTPVKDDDDSEPEYHEIAHCDGCSEQIVGIIHKCCSCFDYDLCGKCYPVLSKTHHDGEHHFTNEIAATCEEE